MLYIGTSGWDYPHWDKVFYPDKRSRFEFYKKKFNTVEVNYTFYHLPDEKTLEKWRENAPSDFRYSLKASRLITHTDNRKSALYLTHLFIKRAKILSEKLGCILFQFPPNFGYDIDCLQIYLDRIPRDIRAVFEFRNKDWHRGEVFELLRERGLGYCIISAPNFSPIMTSTSDFIYMRCHGSKKWYASSYSDEELSLFAEGLLQFLEKGVEVYVYFNNDAMGYAPFNALSLISKIKKDLRP
jgi:uncharacterized protein YecE (DUF72 family)